MAEYDDNLTFLRSSERFPKINKRPIQDPKVQIGSEEYNRIIGMLALINAGGITGGIGVFKKYTMSEYLEIVSKNEIENTFYTIYKDNELQRVYIGKTLVMRKKVDGETPTSISAFPIVFPIIFA